MIFVLLNICCFKQIICNVILYNENSTIDPTQHNTRSTLEFSDMVVAAFISRQFVLFSLQNVW